MKPFLAFLLVLSWASQVLGRAVFAHFMVGNTEHYSKSDWVDDIKLAQDAHIDAFALNMAKGEPMNAKAIADAFSNAEELGFKLFFSFDYAGRGPYAKDEVITWINKYAPSSAYFRHQGRPLVSTFEGPDNAEDWHEIKAVTGCFFVPDWSSLGAGPAVRAAGGVADGLFSWAGWPWGAQDMDTYVDASYIEALNGKPYMMPVSPWFYTNLPGYSKNWLWRGDHLWYDRWIQVNTLMPEFVQIISWNDYGESHHIGPVRDHALVAFEKGSGNAPYMYSLDHHGWRNNKATVTFEGVSFWYRPVPKRACGTGGTTGNTVSQLQMEFQPYDIIDDSVFFTVLATQSVKVTVTIGGVQSPGVLRDVPDGGVGLYHGSAPFNGRTGDVKITVWRNGILIADEPGPAINGNCRDGMMGFDAWAGGGLLSKASRPLNTPSLEDDVCIRGTGANEFDEICRTTCSLGYCPQTACVCRATGALGKLPTEVPGEVFPAEGLNSNYIGLCNVACLYGFCFPKYCGKTQYPLIEPTVSPFNPPSCTSGSGEGDWALLCNFACRHGFCPIARCKCTSQGPLSLLNPTRQVKVVSRIGEDHGLCAFACSRGLCPKQACNSGNSEEQTEPPPPQVEMPHLDKDCYIFPECVDLDNPQASSCRGGYSRVSFDRSPCSGDYGRPICCKQSIQPLQCTWRGSGGDCNGQCHSEEVNLFQSKKGGDPGESGGTCSRGSKAFCCRLSTYKDLTSQCYWSKCGETCTSDETLLARASQLGGKCSLIKRQNHYCCKGNPLPLSNCHWVGQNYCADNTCNNKEVTVILDQGGEDGTLCNWWRKKSLCCTPEEAAFGNSGQCPAPYCTSPTEEYCGPDEWASDEPYEDCDDDDDDCGHDELRRDVIADPQGFSLAVVAFEDTSFQLLAGKKERRRPFNPRLVDLLNLIVTFEILAREYPGPSTLNQQPGASDSIFQKAAGCDNPDILVTKRDPKTTNEQLGAYADTEHHPDLQFAPRFLEFLASGNLPNGLQSPLSKIDANVIKKYWQNEFPKGTFPKTGRSRGILTPSDYFFDQFGSKGNRAPLTICEKKLNGMKGNIFAFNEPAARKDMTEWRAGALKGIVNDQNNYFERISRAIAVFLYLNHPDVLPTIQDNRENLFAAARFLATLIVEFASLEALLKLFDDAWYTEAARLTHDWVEEMLNDIQNELAPLVLSGRAPANMASINTMIANLKARLGDIKAPPRKPRKPRKP
ncbi:mutanase [Colletotrichum musicola]|uniref:Mutanase n=1 Tax=Colletotrichum musicola TaxID=2175873 RepID=A0A8H6J476_9PEZI|nr:mutanase [Colletotrichum musicola]